MLSSRYAKYLHSGKDELFNESFDFNYKMYFNRLNALSDKSKPMPIIN